MICTLIPMPDADTDGQTDGQTERQAVKPCQLLRPNPYGSVATKYLSRICWMASHSR